MLAHVGERLSAAEFATAVGGRGLDPAEVDARLRELVLRARIDTLDLLGDPDGAARLAKRELDVQRWGAP